MSWNHQVLFWRFQLHKRSFPSGVFNYTIETVKCFIYSGDFIHRNETVKGFISIHFNYTNELVQCIILEFQLHNWNRQLFHSGDFIYRNETVKRFISIHSNDTNPCSVSFYRDWTYRNETVKLSIIWRLFHGSKMFNSSCWAMRSVWSFITACRHSQNSSSSGADELSKLHARMSGSCVRVCFSLKVHN